MKLQIYPYAAITGNATRYQLAALHSYPNGFINRGIIQRFAAGYNMKTVTGSDDVGFFAAVGDAANLLI